MKKELIKLANSLDEKGFYEEADCVDAIIRKAWGWRDITPEYIEDKIDKYISPTYYGVQDSYQRVKDSVRIKLKGYTDRELIHELNLIRIPCENKTDEAQHIELLKDKYKIAEENDMLLGPFESPSLTPKARRIIRKTYDMHANTGCF